MHVRCAAQGDHRLRQERHRDDHLVRRRIARRPEVEQPGPPVQVPLAGGVELLQHVQEVVALPGGVSVGAGPIGGDQPRVEVDRLDALIGVGPVIGPVAVHHRLGRTAPAARPVAEVLEAAIGFVAAGVPRHVVGAAASRRVDAGDGHERMVGPARQGHPPVTVEHFQRGRPASPAEADRDRGCRSRRCPAARRSVTSTLPRAAGDSRCHASAVRPVAVIGRNPAAARPPISRTSSPGKAR